MRILTMPWRKHGNIEKVSKIIETKMTFINRIRKRNLNFPGLMTRTENLTNGSFNVRDGRRKHRENYLKSFCLRAAEERLGGIVRIQILFRV